MEKMKVSFANPTRMKETLMKRDILITFVVIFLTLNMGCASGQSGGGNAGGGGSGKAGSTARFAISEGFLYALAGEFDLQLFNIQDPSNPKAWSLTKTWQGMETIYPYEDMLFMGATDGMYIYDISDPKNPKFLSTYQHIFSCDPVVVQGTLAFVTLRDTAACRGEVNQLDVIDLSDPQNPELIDSYEMQAPYGLAIEGTNLFICDGFAGLEWFDVTEPTYLELVYQLDTENCNDLIIQNNNIVVMADDAIRQYSFNTEERSITLLSEL